MPAAPRPSPVIVGPDRLRQIFYPRWRKKLVYAAGDPRAGGPKSGTPGSGARPTKSTLRMTLLDQLLMRWIGRKHKVVHATSVLVMGGNPLLEILAALRAAELGRDVVLAPTAGGVDGDWGYGLLRHPAFRAVIDRALSQRGETAAPPPESTLFGGGAAAGGGGPALHRDAELDAARAWLEALALALRARLAAARGRVLRLSGPWHYRLTEDLGLPELRIDLLPPETAGSAPAEAIAADPPEKRLCDDILQAEIRRHLPRLVYPRGPYIQPALCARHLILTSDLPGLAAARCERRAGGEIVLHHDRPRLLALGSAARRPADSREALRRSLTDIFRVMAWQPEELDRS